MALVVPDNAVSGNVYVISLICVTIPLSLIVISGTMKSSFISNARLVRGPYVPASAPDAFKEALTCIFFSLPSNINEAMTSPYIDINDLLSNLFAEAAIPFKYPLNCSATISPFFTYALVLFNKVFSTSETPAKYIGCSSSVEIFTLLAGPLGSSLPANECVCALNASAKASKSIRN